MSFSLSPSKPSSWINFPTAENPSSRYKYLSVEINFDMDLVSWQRNTYSILDWLGALGGLYDSLYFIIKAIVMPISTFTLHSTILKDFFRFRPSRRE